MKAKAVRRGTKKNNVTLREKVLKHGKLSLYLDIYIDGKREYEFLRLYIDTKARTPIDRQTNKETYALAESVRLKREKELNHSIHGIVMPTKLNMNFFDFADDYVEKYQKKDIRMIKGVLKRFEDFLTEYKPRMKQKSLTFSQLTPIMMTDFVEYLESKSTGEGAYSYYQRFKKILNRAIDEGFMLKNPTDGIRCRTVEGLRKDILTNDEIIALAQTPCQNKNLTRAFLLSCSTGLRFCDVNNLRYKDIDFSTNKMTVNQQKTGKPVIVDLNKTAQKLIGEAKQPDDKVFDLPSATACNKTLKAWVKRAGIDKHITWHCARHSFAVNLLTSDERPDIKTVSSTLGHASLKHTEKYTRVVDKLKKQAVNALPDYL